MTESSSLPVQKKSDLPARLMSGIPAALVVLGILISGSSLIVGVLALVCALIGIHEFKKMFEKNNFQMHGHLLLGGSVLMGIGAIFGGVTGLNFALLASVLVFMLYPLLFLGFKNISETQSMGLGLLGLLWIPWSMNHFMLIRDLSEGMLLIFYLLLIIWISDTFAYFGGKFLGKTPLAPTISPKKTIEGSLCGALGSGVFGAIFTYYLISFISWWQGLLIAIIIAVLGQMGDLVESKLKRLCDVKDSGRILPGHGGMLDRVDGFLTTVPLFYYLMVWFSNNTPL